MQVNLVCDTQMSVHSLIIVIIITFRVIQVGNIWIERKLNETHL